VNQQGGGERKTLPSFEFIPKPSLTPSVKFKDGRAQAISGKTDGCGEGGLEVLLQDSNY
jgi:hypothetical protein